MPELDTVQPSGPQTTIKCTLDCKHSKNGHCQRCIVTLFEKDGKVMCNQYSKVEQTGEKS